MRLHGLALIGLVSFAGCSITADAIPDAKGHAKAFVLHIDRDARGRDLVAQHLGLAPIFAAAPATTSRRVEIVPHTATIDVATIAASALQLPAVIDGLRHDLLMFGYAVLGFAFVGALLAIRARSKACEPSASVLVGVGTPTLQHAGTAIATLSVDAPVPTRRCSCDAAISARSRTGRCRRCARRARLRPRNVVLDMPAILATAIVRTHDDEDGRDAPKRVVLTEARIGQQRAYYTSESFS